MADTKADTIADAMPGGMASVSIIMRTRDRPLLLRRALADVCAQTYQDWRLVVVDDGGDADEVDRLVAGQHGMAGRVTVLHNADAHGRAVSWNQGVEAGKSRYLAVHDDDDTWHPSFLARTVAHLDATDDAAVAVRTEIVYEHVEGDEIVEHAREVFFPDLRAVTLFDLVRTNRVVPIAMLYRRSVHEGIGPVREDLPVVEDWEFNLRLAAAHTIGFLDGEALAFWHQRRAADGSLANSVIGLHGEHRTGDLKVRNEALKEHVARHGLGGLLYLTQYVQQEFDHVHGRFAVGEDLTREALRVLAHQGELLQRQESLLRQQEQRLARLERSVSDASLVALVRRRYRRLKGSRTG
ncbi:MAG: hypothetical protein JWO98_1514 [Frankiales bacterium]|nr:hypothetical protein [Frankiales bacterium]